MHGLTIVFIPRSCMFAVSLDSDSAETNLRRSCSLSDLSMPNAIIQPKRKIEQGKSLHHSHPIAN